MCSDAVDLRYALDPHFAPDTANGVYSDKPASAGHCAAVSVIAQLRFGWVMVSAMVDGQSHWFSRADTDEGLVDIDITGDQFGREIVQVVAAGTLYPGTRERLYSEIYPDTERRAKLLAERAGL